MEAEFPLARLQLAATEVYRALRPTPQLRWPLLSARCGCEVWVKHENHLPTGAFKVRGGIWYLHELAAQAAVTDVVAATRGNHGQSIAFAAARHDMTAHIVVPHGNNPDKNRAMAALGADLIEHGKDFDEALQHAQALAQRHGWTALPSWHPWLVEGVASYGLELFGEVPRLDAVYVPIGLGSGVCGVLAARAALALDTEVIGVVARGADAYARSIERGAAIATAGADTLADGLAVREPSPAALAYMVPRIDRVVRVDDAAIVGAIGALLDDTHNVAEGAGAAPLAALLAEGARYAGKRVALVLSGGNLDRATLTRALNNDGENHA